MSDHVDATFYVQIEGTRSRWAPVGGNDEHPVTGAKAVRITQTRPSTRVPDAVMVKLTVRLPAAAFDPLQPEAIVVVPGDLIERAVLEVTATDPSAEQPPW